LTALETEDPAGFHAFMFSCNTKKLSLDLTIGQQWFAYRDVCVHLEKGDLSPQNAQVLQRRVVFKDATRNIFGQLHKHTGLARALDSLLHIPAFDDDVTVGMLKTFFIKRAYGVSSFRFSLSVHTEMTFRCLLPLLRRHWPKWP
jgi:hypothetical protein